MLLHKEMLSRQSNRSWIVSESKSESISLSWLGSYHGGDRVLAEPLRRNTHNVNRLQRLWVSLPQWLPLKTVWTVANLVFLHCVLKHPQWLASKNVWIAANFHGIQTPSRTPPAWASIHKGKVEYRECWIFNFNSKALEMKSWQKNCVSICVIIK